MLNKFFKKPLPAGRDQATGRDRFNLKEFRKSVQQSILQQKDTNTKEEQRVGYQYKQNGKRRKPRTSKQIESNTSHNESLVLLNKVNVPNFVKIKDNEMKRRMSLSKESFHPKKPVSKHLRDNSTLSRLSVKSIFNNQEKQDHFTLQRSSPKQKPRKTKIVGLGELNGLEKLKKDVSRLHQSPVLLKTRSPQQNSQGTKEIMNSINSLKKRFEKGKSSVGRENEVRHSFVKRNSSKGLRASPVSRKIGSIKSELPLTRIRDLNAFFQTVQHKDINQLDSEYISALIDLTSTLTNKIKLNSSFKLS